VYWGTGDKADPTAANAQEKFFGLKDNDRTTAYGLSDMQNITSGVYSDFSKSGWYINLPGGGVKVLADPTVFGGVVYFTTFEPASGGSDPCSQGGDAALFGVGSTSGGGTLTGGSRSMDIGTGIPSAPVISMGPGGTTAADLYVTVSGGGGPPGGGNTIRPPITPPGVSNRTNMLYWRDQRLQ
jgi:Tfp pilus tip-associated adhesin PilY1